MESASVELPSAKVDAAGKLEGLDPKAKLTPYKVTFSLNGIIRSYTIFAQNEPNAYSWADRQRNVFKKSYDDSDDFEVLFPKKGDPKKWKLEIVEANAKVEPVAEKTEPEKAKKFEKKKKSKAPYDS